MHLFGGICKNPHHPGVASPPFRVRSGAGRGRQLGGGHVRRDTAGRPVGPTDGGLAGHGPPGWTWRRRRFSRISAGGAARRVPLPPATLNNTWIFEAS